MFREMTFRKDLTVSVLSERRAFRPWGLAGGLPAARGVSFLPLLYSCHDLLVLMPLLLLLLLLAFMFKFYYACWIHGTLFGLRVCVLPVCFSCIVGPPAQRAEATSHV